MLKNYVLGALLFLSSGPSIAELPSMRPFATITAGIDFIHVGQSKTVSLIAPFDNFYASDSSYKSSGSFGLAGGLEKNLSERFFWQLGVAGFYNTSMTTSGNVWQFGLPEFNNFHYKYHIQSSRAVAIAKILGTFKQVIHPYISGEIGAAFNKASDYHETPLIREAIPIMPFKSHTQSAFSWGIGAGFDMDINPHFRLGIGYQFVDLGKATLGLSPTQTTNSRLGISNLYDNQIRIQLSALI
jgi:opacity protein-like surface antigen